MRQCHSLPRVKCLRWLLWLAIVDQLVCRGWPYVQVLQAVFEPTLAMITTNFEDFPEHRLKFFALLHAITNHCFKCLFGMNPPQLKLLIDSIIWAFRHTERNVAETGLLLLEVSSRGIVSTC